MMAEDRDLITYSGMLAVIFQVYFLFWHITAVVFGSGYSLFEVASPFLRLAAGYSIVSLILASAASLLIIAIRGRVARKVAIGVVMALFFASEFVRMFDWGALYFGGNHIDNNFWAHAFYADGTVYLFSKQAFAIYAAVAIFFAAILFVLKRISASAHREA